MAMQVKFKRYTGNRGLISKETTYCLDAIILPTAEEHALIQSYDRWSMRPWTLGNGDIDDDDEDYIGQMRRPSMADLTRGSNLTFKNFNSVFKAEQVILTACERLLATVNALATFDSSERVLEVDEDGAVLVAAG